MADYPPLPETALAPPTAPANPLAMVSGLVGLQNDINKNQMFQQQFLAKQRAGEIMAQAPDFETGLKTLAKDPIAGPWAGEYLGQMRQMQGFMLQNQGTIAKQNLDAIHAVGQMMPAVIQNPDNADAVFKSVVSSLPPEMQKRALPGLQSVYGALMNGVPQAPAEGESPLDFEARRRDILTKNAVGQSFAAGVPSDIVKGVTGGYTLENTGNQLTPYYVPGNAATGGSPRPTGVPVGIGAPAGITSYNDTPIPHGAISPGTVNPLMEPLPQSGRASPNAPGGLGYQTSGSQMPSSIMRAYDGTVLNPTVNPGNNSVPEARGPFNTPIKTPLQTQMAKQYADNFATEGKKEYDAANASLVNLKNMSEAFDKLAEVDPKTGKPGFEIPGAFGGFRTQIASAVNTLGQITGAKDLSFDPTKVGSAELLNELTNRMGTNLTQQTLGSQREAAETISRFTNAVPNIDDTYLGAKLKIAAIEALSQRAINQYQFTQAWSQHHYGDITGAADAFNSQLPPEKTGGQVLESVGLTPRGKFMSKDAMTEALTKGLITPDQARSIGIDKGQ